MSETAQIVVETEGLWLRRHRLVQGRRVLGELAFELGARASFSGAEGQRAQMRRTSWWRTEYRLWEAGAERGSASRAIGQRTMTVCYAGQTFALRPLWRMSGSWVLADAPDAPLAEIQRGSWGHPPKIIVYADVDTLLLAFAYFLIVLRWRASRRM